ncbi:hypothetical protein ADUPG1_009943, partial [Aduncisulcus paluster]
STHYPRSFPRSVESPRQYDQGGFGGDFSYPQRPTYPSHPPSHPYDHQGGDFSSHHRQPQSQAYPQPSYGPPPQQYPPSYTQHQHPSTTTRDTTHPSISGQYTGGQYTGGQYNGSRIMPSSHSQSRHPVQQKAVQQKPFNLTVRARRASADSYKDGTMETGMDSRDPRTHTESRARSPVFKKRSTKATKASRKKVERKPWK